MHIARAQERHHLRGGGAIGAAVARAFAAEGARVYLAGSTLEKLEKAAEVIRGDGGQAQTAQLDALDEQAVDAHADRVAADAGNIDISFNLITHGDVQGTPLVEMTPEGFARPVEIAVRTMFLTSRAAARHMIKQGSDVILVFGGEGDRRVATTWAGCRSRCMPWKRCDDSSRWSSASTASAS